jgi:hypothetical protein
VSGTAPLGEIAKSTTTRFNLVGLTPSVLLAVGVGILIASGAFSGVPSMHLLVFRLREVNVLIASVLFLTVLSATLVLHPFQLLLVRILEGYWDQVPMLRRLRFIGVEMNRRRRTKLSMTREDAGFLIARQYPEQASDLLPTRLGNVLRAAERRAGRRHGFTRPIEMLPRIYPYLSSWLSQAIGAARDELDIACRMCVVLWMLAVISGAVFAADGAVPASDGALLAVPATAALVGVASYRGAVRSAREYGRHLFYVFDLHRRDLIRALGYEPPRSPEAEFELIQAITRWLVDGSPAPAGYRQRPNQRPMSPS